jgi:hypothetical protein
MTIESDGIPPLPQTPRLTIEKEVRWEDIAPLLDEIQQQDPNLQSIVVERHAFRIGAGGPGFDIVPILFFMTGLWIFGAVGQALVSEIVKDAYPALKKGLYAVYRRLPGMTPNGKVYPMGFGLAEGTLTAQYRLPEGLSDVEFGEALTSVPTHFASLQHEGRESLVFTYDPSVKGWVENREASEFRTWLLNREDSE